MNKLVKEYVKKPIKIQAILYDGSKESIVATLELNKSRDVVLENNELIIKTLEGNMKANIGDYIIKGISGEIYPCKPDIFEKTYEKINTPYLYKDSLLIQEEYL